MDSDSSGFSGAALTLSCLEVLLLLSFARRIRECQQVVELVGTATRPDLRPGCRRHQQLALKNNLHLHNLTKVMNQTLNG